MHLHIPALLLHYFPKHLMANERAMKDDRSNQLPDKNKDSE
jgi:hypothetical protein